MELRQLRYFVRVVELGSMSRAALDLNLVQSALSQQISRLEGELSTRLLQRTARASRPPKPGWRFSARRSWRCAMPSRPRVRRARRG
jgi:LysR family tcuABC transcriptional regulator